MANMGCFDCAVAVGDLVVSAVQVTWDHSEIAVLTQFRYGEVGGRLLVAWTRPGVFLSSTFVECIPAVLYGWCGMDRSLLC